MRRLDAQTVCGNSLNGLTGERLSRNPFNRSQLSMVLYLISAKSSIPLYSDSPSTFKQVPYAKLK